MINGKKLAVITCCLDDWGGSEELWSESIPVWLTRGIDKVDIFKNRINLNHPGFAKLQKHKNISFHELDPYYSFVEKRVIKFKDGLNKLYDKIGLITYNWNKQAGRLYELLKKSRPDLALISQGINFDGLAFAFQCLRLNIPYFIVSHKAVDFFWPDAGDRPYMRETLKHAEKCMFVSNHNQRLTEEQFGLRLPTGMVILNPIKTKVQPLPYPSAADGFKLACIGRLFVIDKGQDILLRILAQPKWRERNMHISFIGLGKDDEGLTEMAALLDIQKVTFAGYNSNLKDIWLNHHALILPSRSEGLPLTVIEAMSLGRTVITTNVGGNTEIIENNVNGFIGEANEADFEAAMENAWNQRDRWAEMGLEAAEIIRQKIPETPEALFIDTILNFIK